MKFIKLIIHASSPGVEAVTGELLEMGIEGIVIEDPRDLEDIIENKDKYGYDYIDNNLSCREGEAKVILYLEENQENRALLQEIKIKMMALKSKEMEGYWNFQVDLGRLYCEDEIIESVSWEDKWKEAFRPIKITENLLVKPAWESYIKKENEIVIELDPGMAFGTGSHETTRLAMMLLEKFGVKGKKILDIGVGSGILALGAALLGAERVIGIDNDSIAVEVASANVVRNNLIDLVKIEYGDFYKYQCFEEDLVVANLMANLLIDLLDILPDKHEGAHLLIMSGILTDKEGDVLNKAIAKGYEIIEIIREGEWSAIACRNE